MSVQQKYLISDMLWIIKLPHIKFPPRAKKWYRTFLVILGIQIGSLKRCETYPLYFICTTEEWIKTF